MRRGYSPRRVYVIFYQLTGKKPKSKYCKKNCKYYCAVVSV